ncbi:winged helix-turn-helix domain-containing protein [Antribacter sp. KLBMP9083]|uniref:Winged helix-turn-helix domain-containing protein n=1 Tax=Antribacter soli TaxID=2910976 RepID=A0AA41QEC3_9MICO|nr:winged helix-turn-helix domain-containing protein [Antribacter soli]MCF4120564.1 winged helix-turn-helix domain-containing protein [Antribacter soli]
MAREPVVGTDGSYVVCVGLPLHLVSEIARLLRGQSVVLATADTDGARALLGPPAARPYREPAPSAASVVPAAPPPRPSGRHVAAASAAATAAAAQAYPAQAYGAQPYAAQTAYTAQAMPRGARAGVLTATEAIPVIRPAPLVRGPLSVDLATREVTVHGQHVHLSVREFDLLATLASEVDRVWSFAELTAHVWRTGYLGDPDPVTSAVKRLRKRLRPVRGLEVASVRGVGYRLMVPV